MKLTSFLPLLLLVSSAWLVAAEPCPIVEVETEFIVGAHGNGKWLKSEMTAKSVKPGTKFRVYGLTREVAPATGGKPTANTDICQDVYSIALSPKPNHGVIALAAPWNALPRAPKVTDPTQAVYIQAVREFLQSRGLRDPKVKITKILRVDLDGDGEDERDQLFYLRERALGIAGRQLLVRHPAPGRRRESPNPAR